MKASNYSASRNLDDVITTDGNSSIFSPAVAVLSGLAAQMAFVVPSIPGWIINLIVGLLVGPLVHTINRLIDRRIARRDELERLAGQQQVAESSRPTEK